MAVLAQCKRDACVADSHLTVADGFRLMALGAEHLFVGTVQVVLGRRVIEAGHILPFRDQVAPLAVRADLPAVLVLMAPRTLRRQAKVSSAQITHANNLPSRGRDVLRAVASLALQTRVPTFQGITGLAMVELFQTGLP